MADAGRDVQVRDRVRDALDGLVGRKTSGIRHNPLKCKGFAARNKTWFPLQKLQSTDDVAVNLSVAKLLSEAYPNNKRLAKQIEQPAMWILFFQQLFPSRWAGMVSRQVLPSPRFRQI